MKLILEFEQTDQTEPPEIRMTVDGQDVKFVNNMTFEYSSRMFMPIGTVNFVAVDNISNVPNLLKDEISKSKKLLSYFKWIFVK
jgi:hypothetical protein